MIDSRAQAVVYAASGDVRPEGALEDIRACLAAGLCVVSPPVYALHDPASAPDELVRPVIDACERGNSSLFVSGIDPGWGNDLPPLLATGLCHDSTLGLEEFEAARLRVAQAAPADHG